MLVVPSVWPGSARVNARAWRANASVGKTGTKQWGQHRGNSGIQKWGLVAAEARANVWMFNDDAE